ncbi:DegT/DnrJ/EryC1/StrS family aminotransferase [Paraflavitalea sp. CAU 1676]|uniref:DegT/DnrJ/EryC1/StrS family aminotransferase n=1 Tax=Paraflavitalea sp. CAU 1676 TaxID=3032598 RepID=UPI0023DB37AD|nr:DegT/DnrJ/EryC1/StrS family aminotransferase [Paraflavitalea sp. CAU 1676]MDF2189651.1 DegT/DnrJ/EryC1/StrS family aminotransferase [Paraflavitalea sp. CAU 1676]
MIPVTKPFLPPVEEYEAFVRDIWQRQWLTNNGPLVNELELKLKVYLDVPHMLFVSNGTIALQLAIRALELKGEIITTPFTFIATTSSAMWENCKPVFVDIDPGTLNIDPAKIEEAITPETSAIIATHVFGNPCDIMAIEDIARKHGLKVIYDASHCFGTKYMGKSVFSYGDVSTTSFHATKIYHTIEGGAVFTQDPELLKKMAYMRNFGFDGPENFACVGINAKNSEFHAAMGLANLKYADEILAKRKELYLYYVENLERLDKQLQSLQKNTVYNYSYLPILLPSEEQIKKIELYLNANLIYPRRYFFPSLHTLNFVDKYDCPVSLCVSKRVMCLPMHHKLTSEEVNFVIRILYRAQNY